MSEQMREEFVGWVESLNVGYDTRYFDGVLGGGFNDAEVDGLWTTWQAARASAQATIAQQAQMIEHLRGGPTPLYTAVDMATAAADGFRDGVDSFKIRGEVLMEIFHDGGPEPFICAIHGCICLEHVEAAQKDFRENMPDELEQGEGIYTFGFYYEKGQYDEYGRCEIAPGWGFDFVSYKAFEAEEVQA